MRGSNSEYIKLEYDEVCDRLKKINNKIERYNSGITPFPVDESLYRQLLVKAEMLKKYKKVLKEKMKLADLGL